MGVMMTRRRRGYAEKQGRKRYVQDGSNDGKKMTRDQQEGILMHIAILYVGNIFSKRKLLLHTPLTNPTRK